MYVTIYKGNYVVCKKTYIKNKLLIFILYIINFFNDRMRQSDKIPYYDETC